MGYAVIARTGNGPARFKPGLPLTDKQFAETYFRTATAIPPDAAPEDVYRCWVELPYEVGASEGQMTRHILIKLNCCFAHARPVTPRELKQTFGVKQL